ncbi:putative 5-azacytidine-induced protein 1 [Blattamonas nauphoetae]|uniref:5-azacytidine-induced protein 1 n=1 Tax=Blattamonas nauphoetae TaxID=2049346 RepID=A0ABQ9XN18_9EUKA|nr:putative 5-azacytidine-induced protein 1 [Blattamonas nauphoetae]
MSKSSDRVKSFMDFLDDTAQSHVHPPESPRDATSSSRHRPSSVHSSPSFQRQRPKSSSKYSSTERLNSSSSRLESRNDEKRPVVAHDTSKSHSTSSGISDLRIRVDTMKTTIEEQRKTIDTLKQSLEASRHREKQANERNQTELTKRLAEVDAQYHAEREKQIAFLNQILEDKKSLNEKCIQLASEFAKTKQTLEKEIEDKDHQIDVEIQRQREVWAVQEKARREKWQANKERQIKELTAKALQPEIERLIEKHKTDCAYLREQSERELRMQRETMDAQREEEIQRMRSELIRKNQNELDTILAEMRSKNLSLDTNYDQQIAAEREKYTQQLKAEMEHSQLVLEKAKAEYERILAQRDKEFQRQRKADEEAYAHSLRQLEEKNKEELASAATISRAAKEALRAEIFADLDKAVEERVAEIEGELQQAHEEEMALLAEKVSEDQRKLKKQVEEEKERVRRRLTEEKEKQMEGIREREEKLRTASELLSRKVDEQKEIIADLTAQLSAKDSETGHATEESERLKDRIKVLEMQLEGLQNEKDEEEARLSREWRETETTLRNTIEAIQADLDHERGINNAIRDDMRKQQEKEISTIEKKVKKTIETKDKAIKQLQLQLEESENQKIELQHLLDEQREELRALNDMV